MGRGAIRTNGKNKNCKKIFITGSFSVFIKGDHYKLSLIYINKFEFAEVVFDQYESVALYLKKCNFLDLEPLVCKSVAIYALVCKKMNLFPNQCELVYGFLRRCNKIGIYSMNCELLGFTVIGSKSVYFYPINPKLARILPCLCAINFELVTINIINFKIDLYPIACELVKIKATDDESEDDGELIDGIPPRA